MVTVSPSNKISGLRDLAEESSRIMRSVTGSTVCETIDRYNAWSPTYDQDLEGHYRGYVYAAEGVAEIVPEDQRAKARVMDMAAGTGKIGLELSRKGFKNLEALEPAAAMLEILNNTKVYSRTFEEYVGLGKNSVPSDYYDVVVTSGSLSRAHVPKEGIEDFIRVAKPGGFVVITMRKAYTEKGGELEDFDAYVDSLEKRGLWTKVSRTIRPNYFYCHDGLVHTYKVV